MSFSLQTPQKASGLSNCLCHKSGIQGPITVFSLISWQTFKNAAGIRKDDIFKSMVGRWDKGPFGGYHRKCYQNYTAKNHLEREQAKRIKLEQQPKTSIEKSDTLQTRSSLQSTKVQNCWICQTDKADPQDRRKKEKLSKCQTFQAGANVLEAAKAKNDQRIIVALRNQDPVAVELLYHKSCYRLYTNSKQLQPAKEKQEQHSEYDLAFEELMSEVELKLFQEFEVMSMSDLLQRYVDKLRLQGISNPNYRSEKLKARLQRRYEDKISFWHPRYRSESEVIYCDEVPKGQIVETAVKLNTKNQEEIELTDTSDNFSLNNNLYHAAKVIRSSLVNHKVHMPWPPYAHNLKEENISLPSNVFNLLAWILTDDNEDIINLQEEKVFLEDSSVKRLVQSFGQDLMYAVSKGKKTVPKHVALSVTVKNLTGSKELITLLNRFGHAISYDQVLDIETRLAEKQVENQQNNVVLPKVVKPNVFSTFCWDNLDILEETLSGQGTTHCTNGVIIQRQASGCEPPPAVTVQNKKGPRKRTFQAVLSQVEDFNAGRRVGPGLYNLNVEQVTAKSDGHKEAIMKDFAWFLSRILNSQEENQSIPAWRAFNSVANKDSVPTQSVVGYCQLIDESPTEMSTVYTLLKRSVEMAKQMELNDTVVVLDQAIYAKAVEVVWKQREEFSSVVLRMGSFHIACVFLSVIGKRFGDSGLRDLLIESRLVGSGSVTGVLQGKHYNRALRCHKVVLEALLRLNWKSFLTAMEDEEEIQSLQDVVSTATMNVHRDMTNKTIQTLFNVPEVEKLHVHLQEFNKALSKMGTYWLSYIEMVSLLLRFVRSLREGDWNLYLACIRNMLPWMFAYDRINYSRYLTLYLCDMVTIKDTHPNAQEAFQAGEFVVQRSAASSFSQVPVDQTIEQTINRDTKTKGGVIGFSQNKGAVQRWLLTSHERAAITQSCREMAGLELSDNNDAEKEMGKARMATDERDVKKVEATLEGWVNPFNLTKDEEICHLASGAIATKKLEDDFRTAHNQGKEAMINFLKTRLLSSEVPFHDPIKKLQLGTFASQEMYKVKVSDRNFILKADRNLFARLLVVAQKRSMDLREVFEYSLGPLPWSLASADGSLGKTDKSKLLESLTRDTEPEEDVPPMSAILVDGMATLQSLKQIPDTFEELAYVVFTHVVPRNSLARRIDFVTDRYPDTSIKNPERSKRAKDGVVKVKISGRAQKCPRQWKKFLSCGENKIELVQFLLDEWSTNERYKPELANLLLHVAVEDKCFRLSVVDDEVLCGEVPELSSNHEEADTKLLLHAKHAAANGETTIIIKSPDTDVAVLACHFHSQITARLLIMKKIKTRIVYHDVSAISDAAGPELCDALPGLHAFTGCDSVSSFSGKGKKIPLKMCQDHETNCQTMAMLGRSFEVDDTIMSHCEKFVCCLYGYPQLSTVNECRYQLFSTKQSQSHCLPPCQNALKLHIMRANYQAAIWRRSLVANPYIPSPESNGWNINDGQIQPQWMTIPPAPAALLELVMCGCTSTCSTGHCICRRNGLSCTDVCNCNDKCDNTFKEVVEVDYCEDESEDDYDE